jgi:hypothetical protein
MLPLRLHLLWGQSAVCATAAAATVLQASSEVVYAVACIALQATSAPAPATSLERALADGGAEPSHAVPDASAEQGFGENAFGPPAGNGFGQPGAHFTELLDGLRAGLGDYCDTSI